HASLIEGGQEMSTYPARCVAKLERRTVPGENGASSLREILELIGDERATGRVLLERPPSEVDADHPLTHAVAQAAGGDPLLIGVAYSASHSRVRLYASSLRSSSPAAACD